MKALPSWSNHLPKAQPLITITWKVSISACEISEVVSIQSIVINIQCPFWSLMIHSPLWSEFAWNTFSFPHFSVVFHSVPQVVPAWLRRAAFRPVLGPWTPGPGGARQCSFLLPPRPRGSLPVPLCTAFVWVTLCPYAFLFCHHWFSFPTPTQVGSQPSGSELLRDRSPVNVKRSCAPLLGVFLFMIFLCPYVYHLTVSFSIPSKCFMFIILLGFFSVVEVTFKDLLLLLTY